MFRKIHFTIALFSVALMCGASARQNTPSASPREQLQQYVTQLQANPTDDALREKIIQLALTLEPKPAVPDDAAVAAAKGKTIFAHAAETGSKDDLRAAADAFAQASLLAPWMPAYYFNQGSALEKAGQFDESIKALNFYLVAAPNAPDVSDVRGKIEGIKYEKESSAKELAEQTAKARAVAEAEQLNFLQSLAGTWCKGPDQSSCNPAFNFSLSVEAGAMTMSLSQGALKWRYAGAVSGRHVEGTFLYQNDFHGYLCGLGSVQYHGRFLGTISDDGQTISMQTIMPFDLDTCRAAEVTSDAKFWKR